ncbi:hypothetical protein MAR_032897 [Mya arenaria]|uniref:SRCR domain-containing protein n=1 Tax=Mya arenaria TaxID=6604 RepID=A0ABY7G7E6_MYAAR|nr:hypothetical protein MAR_032897 [Mya arenaria]
MEVFVNNNWRTVCEVGFTNYTADLICRDLGFSKAKWYKHNLESNQVNNENNIGDRPNLQNETQYGRYSAVPVSITKDDCKDSDEANATIDRNNALEIPMQTFHDQHQDKKGNGEERNDSDIRIVANHNHDGAEGSE